MTDEARAARWAELYETYCRLTGATRGKLADRLGVAAVMLSRWSGASKGRTAARVPPPIAIVALGALVEVETQKIELRELRVALKRALEVPRG
jgi:hypothetical protein